MTEFVCRVKEANPDYLSACKDLREYQESEYCVLHYPGQEKKVDFRKELDRKFAQTDYDFGGTFFPENALQVQDRAFHEDAMRYRQELWIDLSGHAASFSSFLSTSSPFTKLAPALTSATR